MFNLLKCNTNSLTAFHIIFEKNDKNKNHLHGIIILKNLVDYNINIKNNITNLLKENFELDVVTKNLKNFLDIKNWIFNYMWKDVNNWELSSKFWFLKHDQQMYARFLDIVVYEISDVFFVDVIGFEYDEPRLNFFHGCKLNKNQIEKEIVIDLILYYLNLNNLFVTKTFIYKKIEKAIISYEKISTIREELYENFKEKIILFFITKFPIHFKNFDFYSLMKKYLKVNEKNIEDIWDLTTNRIEPDFSLLEFKDGVYSIKYNKFIPKKAVENQLNNFSTVKYYNRTFKHLGEPKQWIKDINQALGNEIDEKKKDEIFKEICCYIANIFHKNKVFFNKKKVLYIHGDSNTKKSTLIAKPLIGFFGIENVGFISDSKNFKFQHLSNKKLGIIDEFKYDSNFAQEYLKLFAGEVTITEKKYSKEHQIIEDLPIIILSNNLIDEKNKKIGEALFNRIFAVHFKKSLENKENKNEKIDTTQLNIQIDEILKEEESKIIKYCNKVFYEFKHKTKTRVNTHKLVNTLKTDIKLINKN